jgi:leader peptidase (prepilin peptidase)/N-methyltransferase
MLVFWFITVFLIGAAIGSFLNVCIYRLPLEKSIIWPGSRCGHCLKPIRWRDNIPLISYWLLGGRCRDCGKSFSAQYFAIELLTALGFVGLFYLVIVENIRGFPVLAVPGVMAGNIPWEGFVVFGHHALLFCFLLVVAVCDLKWREIPLSVTMTGTVLGLILAVCFPWPWPHTPAFAMRGIPPWQNEWWTLLPPRPGLPAFPGPRGGMFRPWGPELGLYPWPVWGPLPDWLPAGSWQLGLATGLAGALLGTAMLRWVRTMATTGMGLGEALGLGDADLMMMAGAFLGWQPLVVAFFLSVIPALLLSVVQFFATGNRAVTYGPSLAIGVLATCLLWPVIGPQVQMLFFNGVLIAVLAIGGSVLMIVLSLCVRLLRRFRGAEPQPG